jgi:RimJ/RimL family protein N-acetyltransferase
MVMQSIPVESLRGHAKRTHTSPEEAAPLRKFSESVWNIDWSEHLPCQVTQDGIVVDYSTFERALPFIAAHFATIYEEDPATSSFPQRGMTEAKSRYYRQFADTFEFKDRGETVGFFICTPVDWSTYYLRFIAILKEYQGKKLFQEFLPTLFDILGSAGVERVEADTSPSNLAIVHILNKFKFNVAGTNLTDRWGALIRFTRFLDRASEGIFLRQYCTGIKYQMRGEPPHPRMKGVTP